MLFVSVCDTIKKGVYSRKDSLNCVEKFNYIYNSEAEAISFCPYRICPVGAHSDHQHGKITGLAIDKGIHIAYSGMEHGKFNETFLHDVPYEVFENYARKLP